MMPDDKEKQDRLRIERIWRKVHGHPESYELADTEKQWEFMLALLRADPKTEEN